MPNLLLCLYWDVVQASSLFPLMSGDLALSLPAGDGEVATVDSLTDLICQAITQGMC